LWRGVVTKQFRGEEASPFLDMVLKVFARALAGTIDLTLVVIHPAKFLHTASVLPDADALQAAVNVLRGGTDFLSPVFREIYDIICRARGVFDLQYYSHYEELCRTGVMPPGLASRNPFEDDAENIVCGAMKLMKRGKML
jgi:hypothetical protein